MDEKLEEIINGYIDFAFRMRDGGISMPISEKSRKAYFCGFSDACKLIRKELRILEGKCCDVKDYDFCDDGEVDE